MAEYIEREKTVELLRSLGNREYRKEKGTIQDAIKMISYPEYTPTAVDAVVVTRCKDCAHYEMGVCLKIYSDGSVHSAAWQSRKPEDFCSYGERKDGGADNEDD